MTPTTEELAALSLQVPDFALEAFATERAYADAPRHCGPEEARLVRVRRDPGAEGDPLFPDVDQATAGGQVRAETWWLADGARVVCRARADYWYSLSEGLVLSAAACDTTHVEFEGAEGLGADARAVIVAVTSALVRSAHRAEPPLAKDGLEEYAPLLEAALPALARSRPPSPSEYADCGEGAPPGGASA